ncbi:PEP-CTERM sorting domain-containing protein [Rhodopirellula sp. MGV]|uniref:PEP-CTERM sorting domain-containing protein n=1 Tax=Rhodopirellula sp. MGV TaxID=2023130 RepID=UPI000B964BB2|nr:PEP-CTERM sorting domain-containing protein [Rhodopirellula sp. MGV]OYP36006.1 hypothetical protein CGZ80_09630 [Rhodopirellula sp. MGV]PNY36636.1 PEP-CTERM sorting domain-containing protein [Rhodopirellula baltica]
MKNTLHRNSLFFSFAILLSIAITPKVDAGLIVSGIETTPGLYTLSFSQDATTNPIQTRGFINMNFTIDNGLIVDFGSPTGTLTDGTTTFTPDLTGWTGTATDFSFNPNLLTTPPSSVTFTSTPGIDFSVTNVTWRFTSDEFFNGAPLTGRIQQGTTTGGGGGGNVPEPSSFAILAIGLLSAARYRSRRV